MAVLWWKIVASKCWLGSILQFLVSNGVHSILKSSPDRHDPDIIKSGDISNESLIPLVTIIVTKKPSSVDIETHRCSCKSIICLVKIFLQHFIDAILVCSSQARVKHGTWITMSIGTNQSILQIKHRLTPDTRMTADWTRLYLTGLL